MKKSHVIVVGGGPCGSFTALNLARAGACVTVFEEHSEIGTPSHCAGHLSLKGLKLLGLHSLPSKVIENIFYGAIFHSPKGKEFAVRFKSPVTCVVNRVLFDKYIAEKAKEEGARYFLESQVKSLIIKDGFVKGVMIRQRNADMCRFLGEIVVDAEGISSRILRQIGLPTLNSRMLVNAVQAEVEDVKDAEPDMVEVFLGRNYAPGFYAWLIPKGEGKAKVGLAAKGGDPKEYLQKLMLKHPIASRKLRTAKIIKKSFHPITLGGPIAKTYSNGFLVVGDAASQVKPTTGGGVIFGMTCARIAVEVICKALERNNFSADFLSLYQKQCNRVYGFDLKIMLKMRKILEAFSDDEVDEAIGFCKKLSMEEILQGVKDLDFQGQSLLRIMWKPRMLATLFYVLLLYLL
jgi:digeranylgeranylglycerophospholipid reductase